jgi:hypothetical protein
MRAFLCTLLVLCQLVNGQPSLPTATPTASDATPTASDVCPCSCVDYPTISNVPGYCDEYTPGRTGWACDCCCVAAMEEPTLPPSPNSPWTHRTEFGAANTDCNGFNSTSGEYGWEQYVDATSEALCKARCEQEPRCNAIVRSESLGHCWMKAICTPVSHSSERITWTFGRGGLGPTPAPTPWTTVVDIPAHTWAITTDGGVCRVTTTGNKTCVHDNAGSYDNNER